MSATTLSSERASATTRRATSRHAGQRSSTPLPRRLSGPVSSRTRAVPARHPRAAVTARALAVVRSLPEHSLLDRLVRGRAWIPVLGVLLAGIIAMQVEILKLGTTLGRSIERTASLQSKNESLQASIASLGDDQRIERLAAGMGMVTPSPGLLTFLGAHPQHQLASALANIHASDSTGFAAQLAAQEAAASLVASSTTAPSQAGAVQSTTGLAPGVPGSTTPAQSTASQTTAGQTSATQTGTGSASQPQSGTSQTSSGAASTGAAAPAVATASPTTSSSGTATTTAAPSGAAGLPANPTGG